MAQKRMIDRAITTSEKVADLPMDGQLLFDRMILVADDFSLLKKSERWIKHHCLPYVDQVDTDRIQELLQSMMRLNLISIFNFQGEDYYFIKNNKQILKKDRKPNTLLPDIDKWIDIEGKLEKLENEEFHMSSNSLPSGFHLEKELKRTELNGTEEKGTELKRIGASPNSSNSSIGEILKKYKIPEKDQSNLQEWQIYAFEKSEYIGIDLDGLTEYDKILKNTGKKPEKYRDRWMTFFKTNFTKNRNKIESTCSNLKDAENFNTLKPHEKFLYFLKVFYKKP